MTSEPQATLAPGVAPVDRRIFVIAAVVFVLLMALSTRYGIYRDELYFLDCGRHLSLSYVDQPIFTPLIARLSLDLFGASVIGLRLWPALAAFGTVVTGGLLARELGGGRLAQLLGALGVATAPALLGADHILDTTGFDLLAWSVLALIVVRIGRTGDARLWVPAGAVLGIGLANKHSIGFFALVIGILLSGGGRLLASRYSPSACSSPCCAPFPTCGGRPARLGHPGHDADPGPGERRGRQRDRLRHPAARDGRARPDRVAIIGLRFLWRSGRPLWRALAWHGLPAGQRRHAVIFTGNYGEAGAITELGGPDQLPAAVSGQNNEWDWGSGDPGATTIVPVVQPGFPQLVTQLRHDFARVRAVATVSNPAHVSNQEDGAHVYLCTGPLRSWGRLWPSFRYDSWPFRQGSWPSLSPRPVTGRPPGGRPGGRRPAGRRRSPGPG